MKRQYLGDSKDSFKWDYLDFLVRHLGHPHLQVAWMMTPDDKTSEGKTAPELFPARQEILQFCNSLRSLRDPELLETLPSSTAGGYSVSLYGSSTPFHNDHRNSYFGGLSLCGINQLLFLDPDNGFEPEGKYSEKHVRYQDVHTILESLPPSSVITVFQHFRRKKFPADFARIRERLVGEHSTAIYWHSLMFVSISRSIEAINRVREANNEYANRRPVEALD